MMKQQADELEARKKVKWKWAVLSIVKKVQIKKILGKGSLVKNLSDTNNVGFIDDLWPKGAEKNKF